MLEKAYNAKDVEQNLYKKWEASGCFSANPQSAQNPFTIMIPPPNVTGKLHAGHALTMTLQDILVRHARMTDKDALWQPGTDHASIAVERLVTQKLEKEGVDKKEIGREAFLKKAWEQKEESGSNIVSQLKLLGASCDWDRERFTMDEGLSKAVLKVFVELYNEGLIYRGTRLVNWDPNHQTAVSDIEVKHKEMQGHMWHLKYPLKDGGHVTVATTRPETMLGDSAVIVHPDDERYKHLVGQTITLPLVGREIPIIADDYIDMEFGSGCMKVTPAHDFNDYEIGQRHNLEMINIFTKTAHANENVPEKYQGLERFELRKQVVADFEDLGLLEKVEAHQNNVAHAERDDTILEPFLTTQWYLKTKELAKPAIQAVKSGEVEFVPQNWEKTYFHWMENIQDWCISRQLWWGHQIPAWYKGDEIYVGEKAPEGEGWTRDPDTLDTWFSSGLWPFSTLGWPDKTPELEKYYPTDVLVTGFDIIFFWVARMMMFGYKFMGDAPFKKIFIHALVRDEHGQKMSKSKGNVLDPVELIEEFGTDALRYTIGSLTAPGADISLGKGKIEASRNFCTKLWNASRFALMNGVQYDENFDIQTVKHPVNKWMIAKLSELIDTQNKAYEEFRFNDIATSLYHFTWGTYCDWYLELTKPMVYGTDEALAEETKQTLGWALEKLLRLMHPVMPFITEEIWLTLTGNQGTDKLLMGQAWPDAKSWPKDEKSMEDVDWLINVITAVRTARSENNVPNKAEVVATVKGANETEITRFKAYEGFIKGMTKVAGFEPHAGDLAKTDVVAVAEGLEIVLPLEGVVDFEAEKERIQKEIAKFEAELGKINGMLGNENFVKRAPEHVVTEQQEKRDAIMADLSKLKQVLEAR
ncbi:MAG: valine--tRNA ligase [Magnetococcales bacterium]|nr:valine--tRNA ligase [Magnetococcales bacterium]|tara:strand:- start:2756 stop:5362 length:2607 start_codon:yes stop_codon:yes gene_type:complete